MMAGKTEELILYVSTKLQNDPHYGAIKLNKALYYIDNIHFAKYGTPVTDFKYIKQEMGPTPKPAEFFTIINSLKESGELEIAKEENF
ncbi:MAG: type II toxin-antitoxin system antitoxin SocA domain-containing protein, partial [Bacteroidota bacterium]